MSSVHTFHFNIMFQTHRRWNPNTVAILTTAVVRQILSTSVEMLHHHHRHNHHHSLSCHRKKVKLEPCWQVVFRWITLAIQKTCAWTYWHYCSARWLYSDGARQLTPRVWGSRAHPVSQAVQVWTFSLRGFIHAIQESYARTNTHWAWNARSPLCHWRPGHHQVARKFTLTDFFSVLS